ncbi:MAG: hypothetical protein V5A64_03335 [Candidatus Thermoplasmatota archaeon]
MKTLGVYTKDFSLYHDLLKILKKRGIPYVSLSSPNDTPSKVKVILTSHKEIHDIKSPKAIAADAYDSLDHAVDLAIQMLIGKDLYNTVIIGIDPGEKPGIAVIGDDIFLQKTYVKKPSNVIKKVRRFLKAYPSKERIIRIGHGSPVIRNRIINSLISLEIPIEIVDETKTSSSLKVKRNQKDPESAAAIASTPGGRVQKQLPVEPTRGEIRRVQQRSREITQGRFTISEKTAMKVLKGKISLQEAVKMEEKN